MGREVVHFTYDTNFVVVTAIQILCEKDLYDHKDSTICISNKLYDRDDVKNRYGDEITKKDNLLQTRALTYMEKIMPEGGTIDVPQLTAAKDMFLSDLVNDLMTVEYFKKADAQDQYVECKALKKRVYCNFGEHLSAIYTLIADYFGINKLLKGEFSNREIADFVEEQLFICSDFTNTASVVSEILRFGILSSELKHLKYKISRKNTAA